jgi:replication-associated recombination protein RarA
MAVPMHIKDRMVRKSHLKASEQSAESDDAAIGKPAANPRPQGYIYTHDIPMQGPLAELGGISDQDYLTTPRQYYNPTSRGTEKTLAERLAMIRAYRAKLASHAPATRGSAPSEPPSP